MKRAIVTGATGFVGANLVRRLLQDGHNVHCLVRSNYRSWRLDEIRSDIAIHEIDFQDQDALHQCISQVRPDWIFHLAVHGAYSYQTDLTAIVETNILGTINLVEASLRTGFEAFVNTGSSSEYGFKDHAPAENEWVEPNSYYAVTKASATLYCRYTAQSRNVRLPTLRLYSVYGPYEEPTRLIPALIMQGVKGQLPPLVNPDIARDYVYVDDVSEAYIRAATYPDQEPGAVYNVGTGIQTSLSQLVDIARQVLNIKTEPIWGSMPARKWDTAIWIANNLKIQQALDWKPSYSPKTGFEQTVAWFQENPIWIHNLEELRTPGK